jgi:hypothetical protein
MKLDLGLFIWSTLTRQVSNFVILSAAKDDNLTSSSSDGQLLCTDL